MFGSNDQYAVRLGDLVLETDDLGGKAAFMVLIVHRQVVDADQFGVELAGAELDQRQSEFAVDRIAAVGADDDGDLGQSGHG